MLGFMSDVFEGKRFDNEDLSNEKVKDKKLLTTKIAIKRVIEKNPGISKTEFRTFVQQNKGMFKVGELQIIRTIVPDMIVEGDIRVEMGENHTQLLFPKIIS